jgi:hypothetical protein
MFPFWYAEKELKEEAVHVADKVILSTLSRAVCFVVMSIYSVHAPVSPVAINLSHIFAFVARTGTSPSRSASQCWIADNCGSFVVGKDLAGSGCLQRVSVVRVTSISNQNALNVLVADSGDGWIVYWETAGLVGGACDVTLLYCVSYFELFCNCWLTPSVFVWPHTSAELHKAIPISSSVFLQFAVTVCCCTQRTNVVQSSVQ